MNHWDIRVITGSYSIENGKVVIDLYGRTNEGESITARIREFFPYFYLVEPTPEVLKDLKADPEVLDIKELDLEVENERRRCAKIIIQYPFKVPEYRNKYKRDFIVLAADIPFIHRFYYDYNLPSCIRIHGEVAVKKSTQSSALPEVSSNNTNTDTYSEESGIDTGMDVEEDIKSDIDDDSESDSITESVSKTYNSAKLSFSTKDNDSPGTIPLEKKYTTDLIVEVKKIEQLKAFKPDLKILSFDIENSLKDSRIFCICCACRSTNGELVTREFSGDEAKLIKEFAEFVRDFDPDCITGYNIDNFDIPVLLERAAKVKVGPLLVGRDSGKFYKVGSTRFWRLHGRAITDAWWNAKMELRPKQETLNFLSKLLFNETKADVDPSKMDEEWANDPEKVIKYCTRDAELALRILEKIAILDKAMDMATVAKFPMDDALNSGTSTLIDSILIREADKNAIGVPCTKHATKTTKIEGGYVHTLRSGLYNYVCVLDFRSMYPSIIIENNICFTTLNSTGSIKSPTGVRFLDSEQRKGLLPRILEELMADRDAAKKKMKSATDPEDVKYYDGLQAAIKILMNSVYGVFASAFYRFTDQKIGASITAYARKNIKEIISKLENEKYSVIYSDTDSIFIETGASNLDDAIKFGVSIARRFSKGGRVLEFESIFEPFFSHGKKKRYVGQKLYPRQEMVIRGYETQRTDAFDLQREVLKHMFELILGGKTPELVEYSRDIVAALRKGQVQPEQLVISKTVKNENQYKDPDKMANVIAARKLKNLGYEVVPGMKVSYLVTNGHQVPQEVEPYVDGRTMTKEPDWEYYTERMALMISRITDGIVPAHELDYKGLVSGAQQKSLFSMDFSQQQVQPQQTPKLISKLDYLKKPPAPSADSVQELKEEDLEFIPEESKEKIETQPETSTVPETKPKLHLTGRGKKKKGKKYAGKSEGATNLEDFL